MVCNAAHSPTSDKKVLWCWLEEAHFRKRHGRCSAARFPKTLAFVDTSATTDDDAVDEKVHEVVMRLNEYISTRQILTIARPLPPERLVCDIIDDVHAVWFPGGSIEAIATRYSDGLVSVPSTDSFVVEVWWEVHLLARAVWEQGCGTNSGCRVANFGMDSILFHNPSLLHVNAATGTSKCVKCHCRAPS